MDEYKAYKFSLELPVFVCLTQEDMLSKDLSINIGVPFKKVCQAMSFYSKWGYVRAKQDHSVKGRPKRYSLTPKGKNKLKHMLQLKRDHPEKWGKPKIIDDIDP
jgi:predicted ArsR family transcriptional regulator